MREQRGEDTARFELSPSKPEVPEEVRSKWQEIVDSTARGAGVRAALIMKAEYPRITVFVTSATTGNPYRRGGSESLQSGLYCETVMARRQPLAIPNALKVPEWSRNPDLKFGMISYLGYPLEWPDGELFGTICVLDDKENDYPETVRDTIANLQKTIETDLARLLGASETGRAPRHEPGSDGPAH